MLVGSLIMVVVMVVPLVEACPSVCAQPSVTLWEQPGESLPTDHEA